VRRVKAQGSSTAAIFIAPNVTDVVIEDSEISDWDWRAEGSNAWGTYGRNEAGGIMLGVGSNGDNSRIVIQRNTIKSPHFGAFPWDTGLGPNDFPGNHPIGPIGISIYHGGQQNVIRYNEIYGDPSNNRKWLMDGIGGTDNFSTKGSPGADSDIYQNIVMNVFDDAIEAEGGGRNVRIWGNYISNTGIAVGLTTEHYGPTYVFRNVVNRIRFRHYSISNPDGDWPIYAFKFGGVQNGFGDGRIFLFHNTLLQDPTSIGDSVFPLGAREGIGNVSNGLGSARGVVTTNNILHVWKDDPYAISIECGDSPAGSSFGPDLYNGRITCSIGMIGDPATFKFSSPLAYKPGHGWSSVPSLGGGGSGNYQLAGPKGVDVCVVLPNFNDGYRDAGPDCGAHESGDPAMTFGLP
jgi:hypothetical protein